MTGAVFVTAVVCEVLIAAAVVSSIFLPKRRVWPPPSRASWQYRAVWTLTVVAALASGVLGFLDWNSFGLTHGSRFAIGGVLLVGGLGFALWGIATLGVQASLGLGGDLVTDGPYRYSRNPEYVGDSAAIAGYVLLCNSGLVLVAGALGIACFLLMPFAEEPWLRERFGRPYDRFVARVPRFLGWRGPDSMMKG